MIHQKARIVRRLPLSRLHSHPLHPGVITPPTRRKLQTHIAAAGHYEPLIVRPHPQIPRAYQILHGHHRAAILRDLKHPRADCLIWPLTDRETLLFLATANRLRGRERARLRLALLQSLHAALPEQAIEKMHESLPEDAQTLQKLFSPHASNASRHAPAAARPVAFTIFLSAESEQRVRAALAALAPNPGDALMKMVTAGSQPRSQSAPARREMLGDHAGAVGECTGDGRRTTAPGPDIVQ